MRAALEYSDRGCLLWSLDCPGAFARGASREEAAAKLPADVEAFCRWAGWAVPDGAVEVTEEKYQPEMQVEDADSDILFSSEKRPLTEEEYARLKELVLRSAADFERLYAAVPDPDAILGECRRTFYGEYPNTAHAMYDHTNSVTAYYVSEVGAEHENRPGFYENRVAGLEALEGVADLLTRPAEEGSYGEFWSVRKVMRRFLWHDRIHARALYRRARALWGDAIPDPFRFEQ